MGEMRKSLSSWGNGGVINGTKRKGDDTPEIQDR